MARLGYCEMQSAIMLFEVETRLVLISTGLLIMMVHWSNLSALPAGNCLDPLLVHASDTILSVKKRAVRKGTGLLAVARMAAVVAM